MERLLILLKFSFIDKIDKYNYLSIILLISEIYFNKYLLIKNNNEIFKILNNK